MGGNVGVIIKKEDGEQIGMSRWTNVMPSHFKNINLYLGNTTKWFEEFAEEWLQMKADYEKHKDTGNFELNMTPVYFPNNTLSPDEYGIIAVDFKNKKIYSSQDYCNIGSLAFYHMWNNRGYNEENEKLLRQYHQHGLIKEISYYVSEKNSFETIDISSLTVDDIIQLLNEASSHKVSKFSHPLFEKFSKEDLDMYYTSFLINSDWKFTTYNDRSLGVLKVKKELDQDGFTFTAEDNQAWKEYVSYRWDHFDDDDLKDNAEYEEFKQLYLELFKEPYIITKE
jgi:hypothetical protein